MGTILKKFFYEDRYADNLTKAVNEFMLYGEAGKEGINRITLSNLELIEEGFSTMLEKYREYDEVNEIIRTYEKMKASEDTMRPYIHKRERLATEISNLYDTVNAARSLLEDSDFRLNATKDNKGQLQTLIERDVEDEQTVDYLTKQVVSTIQQELDYLILAYNLLPKVDGKNLTEENIATLQGIQLRFNSIKEALRIKRDLLLDIYSKLDKASEYARRGLFAVKSDVKMEDAVSDYIDLNNVDEDPGRIFKVVRQKTCAIQFTEKDTAALKARYQVHELMIEQNSKKSK